MHGAAIGEVASLLLIDEEFIRSRWKSQSQKDEVDVTGSTLLEAVSEMRGPILLFFLTIFIDIFTGLILWYVIDGGDEVHLLTFCSASEIHSNQQDMMFVGGSISLALAFNCIQNLIYNKS